MSVMLYLHCWKYRVRCFQSIEIRDCLEAGVYDSSETDENLDKNNHGPYEEEDAINETCNTSYFCSSLQQIL